MKRALLTAAFAIGLSALFVACGDKGGGNNNAAVPNYNQNCAAQPGTIYTTCGCLLPSQVTAQCTQVGANGLNGFNNQWAYNPAFGSSNFGNPYVVPNYYGYNTVPACAYSNTCYYRPVNYHQPYVGRWYFYVWF